METYASALLSCGFLVAVLSWTWLLLRTFQQRAWWGFTSLILPPMALVFALRDAQKAIGPLVFFALGGMLAAVPVVYSLAGPVDLGLRERIHQEPAFVTVARNAPRATLLTNGWISERSTYSLAASPRPHLPGSGCLFGRFVSIGSGGSRACSSRQSGWSSPLDIPGEVAYRLVCFSYVCSRLGFLRFTRSTCH